MQEKCLREIRHILPHVTIRDINMRELMKIVRGHVRRLVASDPDHAVVSTYSDMAIVSHGRILSINRLFDGNGRFLGYGPRPGFDPLDVQLGRLADSIGDRSITLVEEGVFTGRTLCFVIERLLAFGLQVSNVVVGFCCSRAEAALARIFEGRLIIIYRIKDLVDWLADHDLFPFVPYCGRVLGTPTSDGFMPLLTDLGTSRAFPYILPFGRFGEWASLSVDGARNLSMTCLDESVNLFSRISEQSRHSLSVEELVVRRIGVSLPIMVGFPEDMPPIDADIVGFLKSRRDMLE